MDRGVPRILAISEGRWLVSEGPGARGTARGSSSWESWVEALAEDGVDTLQIREKVLSDRRIYALVRRAVAVGRSRGLRVLVNARADLALAAGADGVHLPVAEVSAARLRRRFADRLTIGCSTHSPAEAERAGRDGADYVTFGPVYETPSKTVYGAPPGLDGLRRAVECGLPVLALGGIEAERVSAVAAAGAAGIAAIRALAEGRGRRRLVAACRAVWPLPQVLEVSR